MPKKQRGMTSEPSATPTVVCTPNPIPTGTEDIMLNGYGFTPGQEVWISELAYEKVTIDAEGKFEWPYHELWFQTGCSGTFEIYDNAGQDGFPLATCKVYVV